MPKVSIDTSLNTVQVVKSGNDLQKTMDKLGRSIEKTFDGRKASGLGDALKPLTQELAEIMTQAGDTAAQIKALEKTIAAAENTRGKLAESLGKAKTEAEQTAAELEKTRANADKAAYALEKVNSEIHAAHDKGQLPSDTALLKRSDLTEQLTQADAKIAELEAKLEQQNSTAAKITAEFESQRQSLEGMTQRHAELARRMEQEQTAAANQAETLQRAQTMQAGDDAMQQYFNKQTADIEKQYAKIEAAQEKAYGPETATQHAEKVVAATKKEIAAQEAAAEAAKKHADEEKPNNGDSDGNSSPASLLGRISSAFGNFSKSAFGSGQKDASGAASLLGNAISSIGNFGKTAFGTVQKQLQRVKAGLEDATKGVRSFGKRLDSIAAGALVFNVISSGLRKLTDSMGTALTASAPLKQALANLQGAAATAAAPIVQALTPALTALANAAATVFAYLAKLVAFFTGKTVSASAAAAKSMASVGSSASGTAKEVKEATKTLAGFDEIEKLDKADTSDSSGGGGGSGTDITPNYDFTGGENPFLRSILDAIETGDWYMVGELIAEKLRDSLNAVPWPDIQNKVQEWVGNAVSAVNGFIATPGIWEAIGHTFAQGLNTVTIALDTWYSGVQWDVLGAGLANGLTTAVNEIQWDTLGRVLTGGLRGALETLHGFVTTYEGWATLGSSIAAMVMAALGNIDWVQAAGDLSALGIGLLTAVITALQETDWSSVGKTIADCLMAVDWVTLLTDVVIFIGTVLVGLAETIVGFFEEIGADGAQGFLDGIMQLFANIGTWVKENMIDPLVNWVKDLLGIHSPSTVFAEIGQDLVQGLFNGISGLWHIVKDGITERFDAIRAKISDVWNSISSTTKSIWDGITGTIRSAVNSIIGFINGMISGICSGLNSVIGVLNGLSVDLPDWLPGDLAGKHLGFSIGTVTAPQIPYLAQGAVIPANREFLAVLGDQSSGTNVEAPLATIQEAVANVMQDMQAGQMAGFEAVVAVLRDILSAVYGIELTDEQVGRAAQRWQARQTVVAGGMA